MKNILFATVRQGNTGDEFILLGVLNIIESVQSEYNRIILNKNVEVCRRLSISDKTLDIDIKETGKRLSINLRDLLFKDEPLEDNSFADYYTLDSIDAVVFAGTPEWMVYKLKPLYEKLAYYDGPIFFLGLGFHEGLKNFGSYSKFDDVYRRIHKKAKIFTVRDRLLQEYLRPEIEAFHLPCPALLCSKTSRKRERIERIGFTLQAKAGDARVNYIPEETYRFCIRLLEDLGNSYEVDIVCHWVEDLLSIDREFGDRFHIMYSYDAKDYLDIYDKYDLVISTRVHGSGIAASLGIPTFTISHSLRTDTVNGFLSRVISPEDHIPSLMDRIHHLDIENESSRIISHKNETLEAYQKEIKPFFE